MGDSFAAGKGAIPVTQGYAYLLYQDGVFGNITNVTFANAAVPSGVPASEGHPTNLGYRVMEQAFIDAAGQ